MSVRSNPLLCEMQLDSPTFGTLNTVLCSEVDELVPVEGSALSNHMFQLAWQSERSLQQLMVMDCLWVFGQSL